MKNMNEFIITKWNTISCSNLSRSRRAVYSYSARVWFDWRESVLTIHVIFGKQAYFILKWSIGELEGWQKKIFGYYFLKIERIFVMPIFEIVPTRSLFIQTRYGTNNSRRAFIAEREICSQVLKCDVIFTSCCLLAKSMSLQTAMQLS